jgi:hypothetical protein
MPRGRSSSAESDLYPAVKAFLEGQGYDVKAEVRGCDVVAIRGDEPPVIVELKLTFSLALVLQGVDRLELCRRLGLGLLTVAPGRSAHCVEVIADPVPYRPRRRTASLTRLLGEHARRVGDPNRGGVTRTPIVTAYRQEALRCAMLIERGGQASLQALRETGLVPNASRILQRDVYGWFRRLQRATYALTERARQDLGRFAATRALPDLAGNATIAHGATMKD